MENKIVLVFSGQGANDAVRGLITDYGDALASIGLPVVNVSHDPAEMQYAVDRMSNNEVRFALSFMGIGQDIMVKLAASGEPQNVWEAFEVPLVKLYGDLPAYFVDRHRDVPRNAVNLYHATEFVHFRRRWIPEATAFTSLVPPLPIAPMNREKIDHQKRRTGKLVFLKNGNSPMELRALWRDRLAPAVLRLMEQIRETLLPKSLAAGVLHLGDEVATLLAGEGIDPDAARRLVIFICAQIDDYFRRIKSQMIAETLLDFPVQVQGSFWQHVDFRGRKAVLVDGQDFAKTQEVYSDQLGIIDMSANVDTWPHDRVQRAAGSYAIALTNRQGWLSRQFPGFEDLAFDFTPESIGTRVSDVLANKERYLELGVAFGDQFRRTHPRENFANRIVASAELGALQSGTNKPVLQPFFIWPK